MSFRRQIDRVLRTQQQRKFYGRVPESQVLGADGSAEKLVAGEGYFEIDLAEAYLRNRREYWRGFLPFFVVVTDFIYGEERKTAPFFVGNQLLSAIEELVEGERVEYRNTRVVGPVPYAGDRLGLFVGLFRAQVTDLAKNLFNFVEGIVRSFDVSRISSYLDIAGAVSDGLSGLLGLEAVELRLGTRDELGGRGGDLRQGYLAYVNCDAAALGEDRLWVEDGRLLVGADRASARRYDGADFCLVRLSCLGQREDYQTLPFYRLWKDIEQRVWEGQAEKTRSGLLPRLAQEIAGSPDLTRRHRFELLQVFKANFENLVDSYHAFMGGGRPGEGKKVTRGGRGELDARGRIQRAAYVAKERGGPQEAAALFGLGARWDEIPNLGLRDRGVALSNREINEQLVAVGAGGGADGPDPEALAEVLAVDALTAGGRGR